MFHSNAKKEALSGHEDAVETYNETVAEVQASAEALYLQRKGAVDEVLPEVEVLINSIAHTPKDFQVAVTKIKTARAEFTKTEEFAAEAREAAVRSGVSAGSAIAGGAAVAALAPTAAMAVATTFGVASTGTAISALGGAAATNAALAWLGGGAVAAGGGGMAAGNALLALAGPIGWGIAGVSVAGSLFFLDKKNKKVADKAHEATQTIKAATASLDETHYTILNLNEETASLKHDVLAQTAALDRLALEDDAPSRRWWQRRSQLGTGPDFRTFSDADKCALGALVNNANALAALLGRTVE